MLSNVFRKTLVMLTAFLCLGSGIFAQSAADIGDLYAKMKWRNVGPANMGGRTVDIDVVEKTPWVIYAAIGPSGVWKSSNNGTTWHPVFQEEATVSVGDIAICQENPDIVWVGTGEATARNSVTIGDGVYKSVDAGRTWKRMGLENTRHISRIVIDPTNPKRVFVAAQGHLWGPNPERGVFRTADGGQTWQKVLFIDGNTGIADLAIHPEDGRVLYAAAWEHRRTPFHFSSGGPGSGIHRSLDGGETWQRLTRDLPKGTLGRIGLAVARSAPGVVYALIEHKDSGIWRSQDQGESWQRTCDSKTYEQVNFRPFYYSQIRVDPGDEDTVYVFSGGCYVSKNRGAKFRSISTGTHSDHHALWIDPKNPRHLIDGNDGGIDISYDGGRNWNAIQHMALAEVYQVGFDMREPYRVYCGLQDNGCWTGPSATFDAAGILNDDWKVLNVMGDGFFVRADPVDPDTVYGNYQMNGLTRLDMRIGRGQAVRPEASFSHPPYRYNWNSPILISPHDHKTVYTGGNFLFRTRNGGRSWEKISPDLTSSDPAKLQDSGGPITPDNTGAEIHCTIVTIAESPVDPGVIWCGTDDGYVQVTRDNGATWTNTVENVPGLPPHTWCSRIESSKARAGAAYAAFDGHRGDDYATYLYKTDDYGRTWKRISNGLPFGWVHVVREDPRNSDLLYAGTEFGVFASFDGGESWLSLRNNLPTVAVRDIAVHPRDNDLIIGTHGRGVWILDDIGPLQAMKPEVFAAEAFLFPVRPAVRHLVSSSREQFARPPFAGPNPPYGLILNAWFRDRPAPQPRFVIRNEEGDEVFRVNLRRKAGLQRSGWGLQAVPRKPDGSEIKVTGMGLGSPPLVSPGRYLVELEAGGRVLGSRSTVVRPDPRFELSEDERAAQRSALTEIMVLSRKMGLAVTAVNKIRKDLEKLGTELEKNGGVPASLDPAWQAFLTSFDPVREEITPKGIGYRASWKKALRGGPIGGSISTYALFLNMSVSGWPGAPTEDQVRFLGELTMKGDALIERLNRILLEDLPRFNQAIKAAGLKPLRAPKPVER